MRKYLIVLFGCFLSSACLAALETTPYGKIVGIETRAWGMHIQVDYTVGSTLGCKVDPGAAYMLDLNKASISQTGENYELVSSTILAAFMAQKDVSFHLYQCGPSRPIVGHVRVRN